MKRFFAASELTPPLSDHDMAHGVRVELQLPPTPHPHPYEHIAIIATDDGLVMRPHLQGLSHSMSYVCIPWGKHPKVQLLRHGSDSSDDWRSSAIVYGIVGVMDLFNGTEM